MAGYLVQRFLYMPLLHLPRIAPLIVSIGFLQPWKKPSELWRDLTPLSTMRRSVWAAYPSGASI